MSESESRGLLASLATIEDCERPPSLDRSRHPVPKERPFVFWDGEGARSPSRPRRQNYVLLGNSTGAYITDTELHTLQMLDFIIEQGQASPHAFHVSFAFDYDANMILRQMTPFQFEQLRKFGYVRYRNYRVEHIPHKWFQVTRYGANYPSNRRDRITVRISDMFGFFQTSFLKAIRAYLKGEPILDRVDIIAKGKKDRKTFTLDNLLEIKDYWSVEGEAGRLLAERLRDYLFDVGIEISQWHGPGVLANWAYRRNHIKDRKAESDPAIYDAARFAYAGGRFECFQFGRFIGGWGLDINSAYPYAISQLPDLNEGEWRYTIQPNIEDIVEFGVYHIRFRHKLIANKAAPVFHRDSAGNISYPWLTDGWYWSPEVATLRGMPGVEIVEAYEYVDWHSRPFAFVKDIYDQRRQLKELGIGAQIALKLLLNSLYGKMAQRVGWQRRGGPPTWHQLEWAGWVTSATRAKLYTVMRRIPSDKLIAVETDGIYTTMPPEQLGIQHSTELGGWEVTPFEEIRYVQSGMYAKLEEGEWKVRYRGLDDGSITPETIQKYLQTLSCSQPWHALEGPTTRFVGYRQALWRQEQGMGPMKAHHCKWETDTKLLTVGSVGKRVHSAKLCVACAQNVTPWEMPHGTIIRSNAVFDPVSHRHDIPWLDHEKRAWREYEEAMAA